MTAGPAADEVTTTSGVGEQVWRAGGVCPVCGNLGPIALEPCVDPHFRTP